MEGILEVQKGRHLRIAELKFNPPKTWANLSMDSNAFERMSLDEKFPLFTKSLEDASVPNTSQSRNKSYLDWLQAVDRGRRRLSQKAQAVGKQGSWMAKSPARQSPPANKQPSVLSVDDEDGGVSLNSGIGPLGMVSSMPGTTVVPTVAEHETVIAPVMSKNQRKKARARAKTKANAIPKAKIPDKTQAPPAVRAGQFTRTAPVYQTTNTFPIGSSFSSGNGTPQSFVPYQPVRFASTMAMQNSSQTRTELSLPGNGRYPQMSRQLSGLTLSTSHSLGRHDIPPPKSVSGVRRKPTTGPIPTEAYIQQCCITPRELTIPANLLIVLDLNGTLIYRNTGSSKSHPRPSLPHFLRYCLDNHSVMIWSSAQPLNVRMICSRIFTEVERSLLVAEWGRDTLELNRADYRDKVQVYKRLDRIWDNEAIQSRHPYFKHGGRWSQKNTVLIDDSVLKAQKQPFNHIEISEFAMKGGVGNEIVGAEVLGQVVAYLEEIRKWEDVSAYMKQREKFLLDGGYRWDWETGRRVCPHVSEES